MASVLAGIGTTAIADRGFLYVNGTFSPIDAPGVSSIFPRGTFPEGINNAGQIVGSVVGGNDLGSNSFLYAGGTFSAINLPGDPSDINNAGQIVGTQMPIFFDEGAHGFLYAGGTSSTFDVPGARNTFPQAINDSGQIVGFFDDPIVNGVTTDHGFLYSGGTFSTIDPPGSQSTTLTGINNAGQILGVFRDSRGGHNFLYSGGTFTTIDVPGLPTAINNAGQIVGTFTDNATSHGFLYSDGTVTVIDVPGAARTNVTGLNDAGQIVGRYVPAPVVPEPSSLMLFSVGLLGLGLALSRKFIPAKRHSPGVEFRRALMGGGLLMSTTARVALVVAALLFAMTAHASLVTWTLNGVKFDDGGTASGYFAIDPSDLVTNNPLSDVKVANFDITTTAGSVFPSSDYTPESVLFPPS